MHHADIWSWDVMQSMLHNIIKSKLLEFRKDTRYTHIYQKEGARKLLFGDWPNMLWASVSMKMDEGGINACGGAGRGTLVGGCGRRRSASRQLSSYSVGLLRWTFFLGKILIIIMNVSHLSLSLDFPFQFYFSDWSCVFINKVRYMASSHVMQIHFWNITLFQKL